MATASGVRAVSTTNTPRNHSGSSTSVSTVCSAEPETPPRYSPAASGTQTAASSATGRDSRTRRWRSQDR